MIGTALAVGDGGEERRAGAKTEGTKSYTHSFAAAAETTTRGKKREESFASKNGDEWNTWRSGLLIWGKT